MERITIGGRTMVVDVNTMARIRKATAKNRDNARRVERELKELRIGPCDHTRNQLQGWLGSTNVEHNVPRSFQKKGDDWQVLSVDEKFNQFMALNRSEVIASKQTF